jgi:hypothetical protein
VKLTLGQLFQRREQAEQALKDPAILEAFAACSNRAWLDFATSAPHDYERREDAYQRFRALGAIQSEMQRAISDHEIAKIREEKASAAGRR